MNTIETIRDRAGNIAVSLSIQKPTDEVYCMTHQRNKLDDIAGECKEKGISYGQYMQEYYREHGEYM